MSALILATGSGSEDALLVGAYVTRLLNRRPFKSSERRPMASLRVGLVALTGWARVGWGCRA
jgi:hypothetical protein